MLESSKTIYAETIERARFFQTVQAWPLSDELNYDGWLKNFDTDNDKYIACLILNFFTYYPAKMVDQMLKVSVGHAGQILSHYFTDWKHSDFKDRCLYSFIPGETQNPSDSGHTFTSKLREVLGIPEDRIIYYRDIPQALARMNKATPIIHAAAINSRARCPVIWPHDGYQHDKGSGVTLADQYRQQNVNMTPQHFANPIAPGESGKGNNRIEPGISDMLQRMETGRFKVFKSQHEWFEEFRLYHRDEGKIVALRDDLMSATRYATQSLRYAEPPTGSSNYSRWSNKASDYGNSNWIV